MVDHHIVGENLAEIRGRIARAAERSGRRADDVTLIAVSKFQPLEAIYAAIDHGQRVFGENRVQERAEKSAAWSGGEAVWHMIGTLQRNKARKALELFDCVQSVGSEELARALDRIVRETGRARLPMMIEVNTSGEDSKDGVAPDGLDRLAETIVRDLPSLDPIGLMTIGPLTGGETAARRSFAMLRASAERLREALGIALPHLSMGMSGDFEAAIEEGSTMVRIGTSIFGSRRV